MRTREPICISPARGTLFAATLLVACLTAESVQAAVVVIANRADQTVACALAPVWGQTKHYSLAPGKHIAVPISDLVEIHFVSGGVSVRQALEPNTLHIFTAAPEGLRLRRVEFSQSWGAPWLHRDGPDGPPPSAVVPVKLLVDEEQPAVRAAWESELRAQLSAASRFIEAYCGVRFEVVAIDVWKSDDAQKGFAGLEQDFRQKVNPEPAWLAVGVTSQYRLGDNAPLSHLPREPLGTHLVVPDLQTKLSKGDHLELLVHELSHYLGAAHSPEPASVMRSHFERKDAKDAKDADHRRAGVTIIDPVNTLVMNLVGEEIRLRGVRNVASMPRSTRQYLQAIYAEMARNCPQDPDVARYAALMQDPVVKPLRYRGRWTDGAVLAGEAVGPWHETGASPQLAGRALFDGPAPIRWLVDESLAPAQAAEARVEMVGGDCLPGRVVGFRTGMEQPSVCLPPHLVVVPRVRLDWPDDTAARSTLRVATDWVRRIVWTPVAAGYQPQTLFYADGRQLGFRAVRFSDTTIRLLCDDGIRDVPLAEVAELHMPWLDPWEAYFQQLAELTPEGTARLVQLETDDGLRLTCSAERFQARARSGEPTGWYHLFQPAWSLDALWVQHTTIRLRCYYLPHEVPLSRIEPVAARQQSDLGGVWPWRLDRNCEGGPLESGGQPYQWGLGVHARSELEFALPPCARSFRTRLGLDRLAGDGGCVQAAVLLRPSAGKPLFASNLILGAADVLDTGPLALGDGQPAQDRRLVLLVDPVTDRCPAAADPLDIRDNFDWLEPLVELDSESLREELRRRAPQRIPAWRNWQLGAGDLAALRLVNFWDETEPIHRLYRLLAGTRKGSLRLSRRLSIDPDHYRLVVAVSRPPQTSASKLDVLVDGQPFGQYEVPVRYGQEAPEPVVVLLSQFAGRQVAVELVQQSPDERALVEWRALALAGRPDDTAASTTGPRALAAAGHMRPTRGL